MLVKIQVEQDPSGNTIMKHQEDVSKVTYKRVGVNEQALEAFLEENIHLLTQEEDYELMVVGKQVINNVNKRTDLVALDSNGNIVIIEIKRDEDDMKARKDNFESQAIRYASSFASMSSIEALVDSVYARYLTRYKGVPAEEAKKRGMDNILEFLTPTDAVESFNRDQRILLVASSFDPSVLSVSAWLLTKGVDITCIEISPRQLQQGETFEYLLDIQKVLPLSSQDDYLTEIVATEHKRSSVKKGEGKRKTFPKLMHMIQCGLVNEGDEIVFRNQEESNAILYGNNDVEYKGELLSLNAWAKKFVSKINAYEIAVVVNQAKTLAEIRREHYHVFDGMGFDPID